VNGIHELRRLLAAKRIGGASQLTVARIDRLVVRDGGRVVEEGSHEQLLVRHGIYEKLWRHQSGGFLASALPEVEAV
jgi:hypothetical protein